MRFAGRSSPYINMDTEDSQQLFTLRDYSFEQYIEDLQRAFGWRRVFANTLGPIIVSWLVRCFPYCRTS